jgi:hypothetical protein
MYGIQPCSAKKKKRRWFLDTNISKDYTYMVREREREPGE